MRRKDNVYSQSRLKSKSSLNDEKTMDILINERPLGYTLKLQENAKGSLTWFDDGKCTMKDYEIGKIGDRLWILNTNTREFSRNVGLV